MTNDEVKDKILQAVSAWKARGGKVVRRTMGVFESDADGVFHSKVDYACCALGCLLDGAKAVDHSFFDTIMSATDRGRDWLWAFMRGFDGDEVERLVAPEREHMDAYEMGKQVAAEVLS